MGKIRNRIANTLWIAPRTVQTATRTTIDTTKSALNIVLDTFIGLWKTGSDIKKAIHESFTKWPWYHRLRKVPTSLALTPFMAIEWVAETLRWTWVNACSSARDIIWNTLRNEWTAIKMMWKSENFDFSTEKLEYKKVSPKNRLASLFKPKNADDVEKKILKDREKTLKAREDKFKKEQEERQTKKKEERESLIDSRKQERERYDKDIEELKKNYSKLEQENKEKDALIATLKKSNTETNWDKEKKAEIVKLNPKTEKKENNSENKEAKIVKLEPKAEEKVEAKSEPKESEAKIIKLEPKTEWKTEAKTEKKIEAKSEIKESEEKNENIENKKAA